MEMPVMFPFQSVNVLSVSNASQPAFTDDTMFKK